MKVRDIVETLTKKMAFAIDQTNRDADYDLATLVGQDNYLWLTNERGDTEWSTEIPLDAECTFEKGILTYQDAVNGEFYSIQFFEAKPLEL